MQHLCKKVIITNILTLRETIKKKNAKMFPKNVVVTWFSFNNKLSILYWLYNFITYDNNIMIGIEVCNLILCR